MTATAFLDACGWTPTSGGTGTWTVSAPIQGYQTLASAATAQGVPSGSTFSYRAESLDKTQWEEGFGASGSSNTTLARTTITANSSGGTTAINFINPPNVFITALTADIVVGGNEVGQIEMWPMSSAPGNRVACNGASFNRVGVMAALFNYLVQSGAATFTNGSSTVGMTNHGRSVNDPIKLFTTGSLPTNFTAGTHGLVTVGAVFFVKSVIDANNVTLSATPGGAAVSAGSAGSGGQTWVCAPHGDGDGATTFTVPDYRGDFIRGLDSGAGVDANRSVGSLQLDSMQGHFHIWSNSQGAFSSFNGGSATGAGGVAGSPPILQQGVTGAVGAPTTDGTNGTPRTAAETRPRNSALFFTIRFAA